MGGIENTHQRLEVRDGFSRSRLMEYQAEVAATGRNIADQRYTAREGYDAAFEAMLAAESCRCRGDGELTGRKIFEWEDPTMMREMPPEKNPSKEQIAAVIAGSERGAAKWLKDESNGDLYFWPAEQAFHYQVAAMLGISDYKKGIAIEEQQSMAY